VSNLSEKKGIQNLILNWIESPGSILNNFVHEQEQIFKEIIK